MKKWLKKALFIGAFILIPVYHNALFAQTKVCDQEIHVQILNHTLQPIIQAEVFIEDLHILQKTDAQGFAHFTKLCNTRYELDIWFNGIHQHQPISTQKEIQIITWEIDSISVLAETHIIQHNIHIAADHLHIAQLPITHSSSISEQLAEIPMIRLQRTGNSIQKPMLQGLTGLRLPLFQDGLRIQGQAWGSDHAPELGRLGA